MSHIICLSWDQFLKIWLDTEQELNKGLTGSEFRSHIQYDRNCTISDSLEDDLDFNPCYVIKFIKIEDYTEFKLRYL